MREKLMAAVLDANAIPTEGRKLEQCFDRLLYRIPGQSPTAETMHRDEALCALEKDVVFGGWVNLSGMPQTFSCCPRTHKMVSTNNTRTRGLPRFQRTSTITTAGRIPRRDARTDGSPSRSRQALA